MSEQPPDGISFDEQPGAKPLFDPYTGRRLDSETAPLFDPFTGRRLDTGNREAAEVARGDAANLGPNGPRHGRRRRLRLVSVAVVVIVVLVGGGIWYVTGPLAQAQAKKRAQQAQAAERHRAAVCQHQLEHTYNALSSIDSRLEVGMVEADFTSAVGEAQAAFDQINQAKVAKDECAAYGDLEAALKQYAKASNYWNNCIIDDYCTPNSGKLNGYWGSASASLAHAKTGGLGHRASGGPA